MNYLISMAVFAAFILAGPTAMAQDSPVKTTQLTDHLYLLSTDQGTYTTNTIASAGDDGVLLVDTQAEADAEKLKRAVDALGAGPVRFIINTHRHVEHVGGNAAFGDAPVVIAHELVPAKLRSGSYLFNEFPKATFPDITLRDSLTLYFNGDRIEILAFPGSHDDNEIIVHFTDSKVVHLSSLVNGFNFPSVDSDGDVLMFEKLVSRAIDLLPHDVVIVSGHNAPGTWDDLGSYREMLAQTTEMVRNGLAEGKDIAALQKEGLLQKWESYAGSYVGLDDWIEYLARGLQKSEKPAKTVFEPLYRVYKNKGAEAAVEYYRELMREHPGEYRFDETSLLVIGKKVLDRGNVEAAVPFLEASLQEHPDSKYGYYTFYQLAKAREGTGERSLAIENCKKALELNPGFEAATELLEELERE